MSLIQCPVPIIGQVGNYPNVKFMVSTDSLATITTAGYLDKFKELIAYPISNGDMVMAMYGAGVSAVSGALTTPQFAQFTVSISGGLTTLVGAPNNVYTTVSSATPGTVRAFTSTINETATVMTSGNVVGVRGLVQAVGASGGFLYGVQGKVIPTGTLSSSEWTAGVFGQLDISGATINAGQIAPIWGDYGATSGTLTSKTGMYGLAMTNTTAAVLAGQLYLYGGATNLMLLNDNNGAVGASYFQTAGTGANSAGATSYAAGTKVVQISVNGTLYWIKLYTSNS